MDIRLTFKHEEEFAVCRLDRVSADDSVRFETIDCALAVCLRGVVGTFVDVVSACVVESVEPLLRAVLFVDVFDDVFAVDNRFVETCDRLGCLTFILGRLERGKRRRNFLDDDFLVLVCIEGFEFRFFCGEFLCKRGRRRTFIIAGVFGVVIITLVRSVVLRPVVGFFLDDFLCGGFSNALFLGFFDGCGFLFDFLLNDGFGNRFLYRFDLRFFLYRFFLDRLYDRLLNGLDFNFLLDGFFFYGFFDGCRFFLNFLLNDRFGNRLLHGFFRYRFFRHDGLVLNDGFRDRLGGLCGFDFLFTQKSEKFLTFLCDFLIEAQFLARNAVFGKKFVFGLVFFLVVAFLYGFDDVDHENGNESKRCNDCNDDDDQCGGAVERAEFEVLHNFHSLIRVL